jgi:protein-S-isoprenylcysteine O-methyltransferase Ste14
MSSQPSFSLGRGWVIAQLVLFALLFAAPLIASGESPTLLAVPLGLLIGVVGLIIALLGIAQLGSSLSIFPRPVSNGQLVQTGVYGIVRHPIYTGVIFAALGWSIVMWSWLAILLTLVLGVFFDRKSAFEETMLSSTYREYAAYQTRVKKLIPWVY